MVFKRRIVSWLKRPVSFFANLFEKIFIPFIIALFLYLISSKLTFKADDDILNLNFTEVDLATKNNYLDYSLIIFLVLLLYSLLTPVIVKRVNPKFKWNIGKVLIYVLINIFTVCIIDIVYYYVITNENLNLLRFVYLFGTDFYQGTLLSLVPTYFGIMWLEKKYLKSKAIIVNKDNIMQSSDNEPTAEEKLSVSSNGSKDLRLEAKELYLIKSDGNYCTIYFSKRGEIDKVMIRNTLKKLEEELSNFNYIIKCQKSYLINLNKVTEVHKSNPDYFLYVRDVDKVVPISRRISKEILTTLSHLPVKSK